MEEEKKKRFTQAIENNKGIVFKVANSYCHDRASVDDLIQEILIQVWLSFDSYKDSYKFSTWLYKVAFNVAISFYRREKRHLDFKKNKLTEAAIVAEDDNEKEALQQHLKLLHQLISEFKEVDRALVLLYLDGCSQREVASIIGISESNVATRMHRIKNKLKRKFKEIKNYE